MAGETPESLWHHAPGAFEGMVDPPLADRIRAFENALEAEPCLNDGACQVISQTTAMCPPCRLRLRFHHITYGAEAYEGTSGAVPRRGE